MSTIRTSLASRAVATLAALLLAAGLAVAASAATAAPAYAANDSATYVAGDTLSKWPAGVTWDNTVSTARTVTLSNANFTVADKKAAPGTSMPTGIFCNQYYGTGANTITTMNIKLVGNNHIKMSSANCYGIYNLSPNLTINFCGTGTLTIDGSLAYGIYSKGPVTFSGGTVKVVNPTKMGASSGGGISAKGGNFSTANGQYGMQTTGPITVTSGSLTTDSNSYKGIETTKDAITISGGTVSATNFGSAGIAANTGIKITGGKVSATMADPARNLYAISAVYGQISSTTSCWGKIVGRFGKGATFKKNYNTYRVDSTNTNYLKLVKYANPSTKPKVDTVTAAGVKYYVNYIGAKAFQSKKISQVTLGNQIKTIGKYAFYKCTKLKTINARSVYAPHLTVGKYAFKSAYQSATVKCGSSSNKKSLKSKLKKAGLKRGKYRS